MPGIWMPTRDQLKKTYTSIVQNRFNDGTLEKKEPPADLEKKGAKFPTAIKGMKGRETVIQYENDLYVRNTKGGQRTYYYGGPAPMF